MTALEAPTTGTDREDVPAGDLAPDLRWWAAANYLTAAQVHLRANPLLREPLRPEQIKPRLSATGAPARD